ncbi:ketopantoate reductase [Bradyrhizobium sp. AZCC 2289]
MTAVMRDLVDECVAVAKADGVTIPGDRVRSIAQQAQRD